MSNKNENLNSSEGLNEKKKIDNLEGYPLYPESEDIYENFEKDPNLNPEDISKIKASNSSNALRRKNLDDVNAFDGRDLDVPGSELDDAQESIGDENEENNYYSLGGDKHDD